MKDPNTAPSRIQRLILCMLDVLLLVVIIRWVESFDFMQFFSAPQLTVSALRPAAKSA